MKIFYRSSVIWNILLFNFFSVFYLFLQFIYVNISSISNKEMLLGFLNSEFIYIYLGITLLSVVTVYRLWRISLLFFSLHLIATFVLTAFTLEQEFSKIILVITFFYLVVGYYLLQFFKLEMSEAYYNANFKKNQLFDPMLVQLPVTVLDHAGKTMAQGHLTNWSPEGCFVYFSEAHKLKSKLSIQVEFKERVFSQNCQVASRNLDMFGYGFKFENNSPKSSDNKMNWKQFYEIIEQLGYSPELMK